MDFFVYLDGHPQATVVLFPWSLLKQSFMEATMGITSCASSWFVVCHSCSTEHSKRGEFCIYGPISLTYGLWASAELMNNFLKMMVVADSAGDARWVRMYAYREYSECHI